MRIAWDTGKDLSEPLILCVIVEDDLIEVKVLPANANGAWEVLDLLKEAIEDVIE